MVFADDDFHVDPEIVFPAQHLDHPTAGGTRRRRPVGDLHVDHDSLEAGGGIERFPGADILTNDAMRSAVACLGRQLQAKRDENRLGHSLIERGYHVSWCMLVQSIVKDAYHGRVAPGEYPGDAPAEPAVGPRGRKLYQHLVALHGAVHLVGRNEDIVVTAGLAGLWPDKAKAVAMEIQATGEQVMVGDRLGQRPVIAVGFDQFAAGGHAVQLFHQHAPFPTATQPKFANQLLVTGALAGGTFNTAEEFAVSHSRYIWGDQASSNEGHAFV